MKQHNIIQNKINKQAHLLHKLEFIYAAIAERMIDRLNYIKLKPKKILDIGSGLNIDAKMLQNKYPDSQVYKLDIAINVLKNIPKKNGFLNKIIKSKNQDLICANATKLPILSNSCDMVWSNLTLPYIHDIEVYLKEIRRVLNVGGCFLLSGLGVDSLIQLRDVGLRTYNFPDMHMIGDILVKLGFSNPVMDMEHITLEYDDFKLLLDDIKILGVGASIENKEILTKAEYFNLEQRFKQVTKDGKTPLTLEIFYAHAWKDQIHLDLAPDQKVIKLVKRK